MDMSVPPETVPQPCLHCRRRNSEEGSGARGQEKDTPTENPQLPGHHSRLSPLSHSGETLSLKSGTGMRKLMSIISI